MSLTKKFIMKSSRFVPLILWDSLARPDVIGFMYHLVTDQPVEYVENDFYWKSPAQFESDLQQLTARYQMLTYDELVRVRSGDLKPSRMHAIITVDDGHEECYSVMRPLLLRYGISATFFVTTDFIDNRQMFYRHKASLCLGRLKAMSPNDAAKFCKGYEGQAGRRVDDLAAFEGWFRHLTHYEESITDEVCQRLGVDWKTFLSQRQPYLTTQQIKTMASEGFTIGAHARNHPDWRYGYTEAEVEDQLVSSCNIISGLTGAEKVPFAFPFTGRNMDRGFLRGLTQRHDVVGMLFDTNTMAKDEPFIFNRLGLDLPPRRHPVRTNLPRRLRQAYRKSLSISLG